MSLSIDVHKVSAVLLADGWHVVFRQSFVVDEYEFLRGQDGQQQGAQSQLAHTAGTGGVSANGFQFAEQLDVPGWVEQERTVRITGPLTAVLAVRTDQA
jgi:hypothetical protein